MAFSSLFNLDSSQLNSEAEVETRLLAKIFDDLGYPVSAIIPKKQVKALKVSDGSRSAMKEVDFILQDKDGIARIIVEAKDPSANILNAWGQAASYALSYNRDKPTEKRIKWLLLSNGYLTGLFPHDSATPLVMLQLSDFASGTPPYVMLRSHIKYEMTTRVKQTNLPFTSQLPKQLNKTFEDAHNLIWKKEKLSPTDAFFEFCKFIFVKIKQDKIREELPENTPTYTIPLTLDWLEAQSKTSRHPVRDVLFKELHAELENSVTDTKNPKKRIFEKDETLGLSAATCKDLIEKFQSINLSAIDEDLNGRMFEVFLTASVRGKELGQFFTPRSVVDFMTRIALRDVDLSDPPVVLDACCGTAGMLIEVMAYLVSRIRGDKRFNDRERKDLKATICNKCLYGVEANERVARIARINMYLHGDGGSHIFHGDGLDNNSQKTEDMTAEQKRGIEEYQQKIVSDGFDLILTNPPFSMKYDSKKQDEKRILDQYDFTREASTVKSSILFINRYEKLLKNGGEMLIVLDDTVLNGKSLTMERKWLLDNFILLGVHSLPFNAFFKAKANIKTSILHLRKKKDKSEGQGDVFMSISNNIGHDNATNETPLRNNLNEIFTAYMEWRRTGVVKSTIRENQDKNENLECPMQYWLVSPSKLTTERFDAFFYCPELHNTYRTLNTMAMKKKVDLLSGKSLKLKEKLSKQDKAAMQESNNTFRYFEIGDVTRYGLITKTTECLFDELPSRAEYRVCQGDILVAINNSSRGTVVLVPKEFDGAICTSGFLVIKPQNEDEGLLLWYGLRSEICRKQIYYLAQTASQPELKIEAWEKFFKIPVPTGEERKKALSKAKRFMKHLSQLSDIDGYSFVF